VGSFVIFFWFKLRYDKDFVVLCSSKVSVLHDLVLFFSMPVFGLEIDDDDAGNWL
jgi:hypothetical protein